MAPPGNRQPGSHHTHPSISLTLTPLLSLSLALFSALALWASFSLGSSSSLLLRWHPFSSSSSPLSSSAPLLPGALLPPSSSSSGSATSRKPLSTSAMAAMQTPAVVVYVTVPDKAAGQKLAHSIIENKLAACVNRVPGLESTYIWEGKVESSAEEMLIIKTRQTLLEALSEHVKANHPYSLPEFIALPIVGGSEPYLNWIMENTKDPAQ